MPGGDLIDVNNKNNLSVLITRIFNPKSCTPLKYSQQDTFHIMYFGNSALTGNKWLEYYITKCSFDKKFPHQNHTSFLWKENYTHYLERFLMSLHWRHTDPQRLTGGKLQSCTKISALALPLPLPLQEKFWVCSPGTPKMQFSLAKSTWSWLFPFLSRACEIKHSSAEEGYSAKGEAVHSLCSIHCVDVLQLPYMSNSGCI